jgi:hypothetical protein
MVNTDIYRVPLQKPRWNGGIALDILFFSFHAIELKNNILYLCGSAKHTGL